MQIEITTEGQAVGTVVLIDGDRLSKVTGIKLEIDVGGYASLQIERFQTDENGRIFSVGKGDNRHLAMERHIYSGTVQFSGDLVERLTIDNSDKSGLANKVADLAHTVDGLRQEVRGALSGYVHPDRVDELARSIEQLRQAPKHFTTSTDPVRDLRQVREPDNA